MAALLLKYQMRKTRIKSKGILELLLLYVLRFHLLRPFEERIISQQLGLQLVHLRL